MSNFTTITLPKSGTVIVMADLRGKHFFAAMDKSNGKSGDLIKQLILQVCRVNSQALTEDVLDEMELQDVSYLSTLISLQMQDSAF